MQFFPTIIGMDRLNSSLPPFEYRKVVPKLNVEYAEYERNGGPWPTHGIGDLSRENYHSYCPQEKVGVARSCTSKLPPFTDLVTIEANFDKGRAELRSMLRCLYGRMREWARGPNQCKIDRLPDAKRMSHIYPVYCAYIVAKQLVRLFGISEYALTNFINTTNTLLDTIIRTSCYDLRYVFLNPVSGRYELEYGISTDRGIRSDALMSDLLDGRVFITDTNVQTMNNGDMYYLYKARQVLLILNSLAGLYDLVDNSDEFKYLLYYYCVTNDATFSRKIRDSPAKAHLRDESLRLDADIKSNRFRRPYTLIFPAMVGVRGVDDQARALQAIAGTNPGIQRVNGLPVIKYFDIAGDPELGAMPALGAAGPHVGRAGAGVGPGMAVNGMARRGGGSKRHRVAKRRKTIRRRK